MLEKQRDTWIGKPLDELRMYVASYGKLTTVLLVTSVLTAVVAVALASVALTEVRDGNR